MRAKLLVMVLFALAPLLATAEQVSIATTDGYVYVNFPKGVAGILTVQPVQGGEARTLVMRQDDWSEGKLAFGRWLPAGQYRITKWGDQPWGDYPAFEVQAGRVTDLGSLVPIDIGGYALVVLPVRHPETEHDIDLALDAFAPYLTSREPLRWEPKVPPQPIQLKPGFTLLGLMARANKPSMIEQLASVGSIAEFLKLARTMTPPTYGYEPGIDAESNLYFGADLGQIRVRHSDGSWGNIGIDTLRSISSVEVVGDSLFAGSDNGNIYRTTDGGKSWTNLNVVVGHEKVIDLDRVPGRWIVTTAHEVSYPYGFVVDRITVHTAGQDDLSDLTVSKQFPLPDPSKLVPWMGVRGDIAGNDYYINTFTQLQRLDLSSMQWESIKPPTKLSAHRVDPRTGIITAFLSDGIYSKIYVSADRGLTWKKVGRPPDFIGDVQFDDLGNGYASRRRFKGATLVFETYAYDASVNDWRMTSEAPSNCWPVRVSPAMPVLCIASNSSIQSQHGSEWTMEYSTQ